MKFPRILCLAVAAAAGGAMPLGAQEGARKELAPPLRKYDKDGDGKLTGDELMLARQAHRRGGREAEPNPDRWRENLERFRNGWMERNAGKFDEDGTPGLSEKEREEAAKVWRRTADRITAARFEIVKKYDKNDDGELNDRERGASREESERSRRTAEEEVLKEYTAAKKPPSGDTAAADKQKPETTAPQQMRKLPPPSDAPAAKP